MFVSPRTVNSFPFAILKVPVSGSIFVTSLLLLHVASFKTLTVARVSSNIQVTLWFTIPVTCCWQNLVIYTSLVVYFIGDHGLSSHYSRSHWDCLAPSSVSLFFVWTISSEVARFAASKTYHLVPALRGRSRFSFSFQLTNLLIHIKHELLALTNFGWNFLTLRWTTHRIHRLFVSADGTAWQALRALSNRQTIFHQFHHIVGKSFEVLIRPLTPGSQFWATE